MRGRSYLAILTLLAAVVASGCSKYYELARIEAGQGRSIFILAERYPDQNQPVFYRIEVNGQVVVPNTYISSLDSPIKDSNFKLVSDKSGSLVGVVEQKLPQKIWLCTTLPPERRIRGATPVEWKHVRREAKHF